MRSSTSSASPRENSARAADELLEEIVVTGIRYSNQVSLDTKRAADSVTEVISAEDIGKMPDKNVADSLARLLDLLPHGGLQQVLTR